MSELKQSSDTEVVVETFSRAADIAGDIAPEIYSAYFRRCPGSQALMEHIDHRMKGRMMDEVLKLLMAEELPDQRSYLDFETRTHAGYGVEPVMYENLLLAVRDTVKSVLAEKWNETCESAWQSRIESLLTEIHTALDSDSENSC